MKRRDESGQTMLLIIGLAVVLLMMIAVVVDASAAYLQRQGLASVADGAALAGADAGSRNEDYLYSDGLASGPRLDQRRELATAAVADHLRETGVQADYPGLRWSVALDGDDDVVVRVRAPLELPLTFPGAPQSATISASASATVQLD